MTQFPPRLHVIFARDVPLGVVIRRGPSKQSRLILWNTSEDQFTPGQWLKARVYERRCDLSPDGKRLIYFAYDGYSQGPARGSYTAVSRPPFFTALALWPKGDAWHGGGLFVDNRWVWLNGGHERPLIEPRRIRVSQQSPYPPDGGAECLGVYFPRLRRDGWRDLGVTTVAGRETRTWDKRSGREGSMRLIKHAVAGHAARAGVGVYHDEHEVEQGEGLPRVALTDAQWADFDHRGRLVYAAGGKLWEAVPDGERLQPCEIADFGAMSFEAVAAPDWARRE